MSQQVTLNPYLISDHLHFRPRDRPQKVRHPSRIATKSILRVQTSKHTCTCKYSPAWIIIFHSSPWPDPSDPSSS